jgi:hypothetical protein
MISAYPDSLYYYVQKFAFSACLCVAHRQAQVFQTIPGARHGRNQIGERVNSIFISGLFTRHFSLVAEMPRYET